MKSTPTLSGRLLLLLGVAVPTVFLSTGVGATSLTTEASVEPTGFKSAVSFAPNLENKLKVLLPDSSTSLALSKAAFCESGKDSKGNFLQASGGPGPGCKTTQTLDN